MSFYEPLFYQNRVDFVVNGHVHAYERTHPMFNYQKDNCGPVYLTVGDGGNVEGPCAPTSPARSPARTRAAPP